MGLTVTGAFDGGNPQAAAAIERTADDTFLVRPFSEDGDGNYKFALHVVVRNDGAEPVPVRLLVDWDDARYMPDRDYVHVGSGEVWRYVPAVVDGTVSTVDFRCAPGDTHVGISPEYGVERYGRFAAGLEAQLPAGSRAILGRSPDNRGIDSWSIGAGNKHIFILTRVHPYETAASYCAEGLLRWLTSQANAGADWLRRWTCTAVPMPNPDGVALGLCKRTAASAGADLEREGVERAHPETAAIMELLDRLRPAGFLDIHGWMHYDEDGIHCNQEATREAFLAAADTTDGLRHNRWNGRYSSASPTGMRHYSMQNFGAQALAVSYRWPGRSPDDMRAVGRSTMTAFLAAMGAD